MDEATSLTATARQQLDAARQASNGRSATTLYGGHERTLRQTLLALLADQQLDEHESPGDATLQVLHGRVRLVAGDAAREAAAGELIAIPHARHGLVAVEDSVVLLTVAKQR